MLASPDGVSPMFLRFPLSRLGLLCVLGLVGWGIAMPHPVQAAGADVSWKAGTRPCWVAAGQRHGIDPWLLYAIGYVESRHNPSSISPPNTNGSRDLGLMQINSNWLPTLRQYGIPREVLFNACASTYIGAWIMAKNIRRYGYSWQAIAAYNVGTLDTPRRRQIGYGYARKVYAAYAKLTTEMGVAPVPRPATVATVPRPATAR